MPPVPSTSAMNIEAKPALYAEIARVLKPGARLSGSTTFCRGRAAGRLPDALGERPLDQLLATPEEMRRLLATAGFQIESWRDTTADAARVFFDRARPKRRASPPPLGLHLLLPDFRPRAENMLRNLAGDRLAVVEIICGKR